MAAKKKAQRVIVRTYSAGVHYGTLVKRAGKEVELADARRIWYWKGANTLHEVSLSGVASGSKISRPVASITLTEAIEIIGCTEEASKNLDGAAWQ
jgi:hypothetical protein